jgi:hypothetical protein
VGREQKPESETGIDENDHKSRIEKAIAEPIRTISDSVNALINQVSSQQAAKHETRKRDQEAAESRHEEQLREQRRTVTIQKRSAIVAGFLTALTLLVLVLNLCIMDKQEKLSEKILPQQVAVADQSMRVGERPYVAIGKSDKGNVADWILDEKGYRTGVQMYFENAGNTPAERFYINGDIPNIPLAVPPHHLELTPAPIHVPTVEQKGKTKIITVYGGITVGALIPSRSTIPLPIANLTRKDIQAGLKNTKGPFTIFGNFEYVNVFNEYCCESFMLTWDQHRFRAQSDVSDLECPFDVPNVCKPESEKYPPQK